MRRLFQAILIIVFIALVWSLLAFNPYTGPTVGPATKTLFIDVLGVNFVNGVTGGANAVMMFGTTGFPQAIAVLLGTGVFFLIIGILFTRYVSAKPANALFKTVPKASTATIREEPRDIIITQAPIPTQKEKEVTAPEQASAAS